MKGFPELQLYNTMIVLKILTSAYCNWKETVLNDYESSITITNKINVIFVAIRIATKYTFDAHL